MCLAEWNKRSAHHPQFGRDEFHIIKAGVDAHADVGAPAHQHHPHGQTGIELEH